MYRYQILIEYEGTHFSGWQIQKKGTTIQQLVENTISKLLKEKIDNQNFYKCLFDNNGNEKVSYSTLEVYMENFI